MVDDLLSCFPNYKNGDLMAINNLKKKIGKMLSFKARNMKISDDSLKKIKVVIFNIINVLLDINAEKNGLEEI
jgi:hypothetical protein